MASLYKQDKGVYHLEKINFLGLRTEEIMERLRRNSLLDSLNSGTLTKFMRQYSVFQLVEMLCLLAVCVFQVNMVKRMFRG